MALSGSVSTGSYQGRYYKVSWTATQKVADNKSTISWSIEALGGEAGWYAERTLKVVIGGTTVYSKSDRVNRYKGVIDSGTTTITHNSDGKKSFEISVQAAVYYTTVNCTGSQTFELDTITRKSTLSVEDGTLGNAQNLTISEYESTFKHKLKYTCGSVTGYILGSSDSYSTANSVEWTAPIDLAAQNTTGRSVSIKFTLYTYTSGGDSVGSRSYTKTFAIPPKVAPTCSITVSDATGKSSTYGGYIKGVSKLKVKVTPKISQGSPIAVYSTTANGATYTKAEFTTDVLKKSGRLDIVAKVTDKRERSGTSTEHIDVLDYAAPTISKLSVNRCRYDDVQKIYVEDDRGGFIKVTYSGAITSLSNKNTAKFQLKYKKSADSSYTTVDLSTAYTVTNGTYVFAADTGSSYDVQVVATDALSKPTTRSTSASSGFCVMDFRADGRGMGLGKACEFAGLDVGFETQFHENTYVGDSKAWDDGLGGTKLSPSGGIVIQRVSGSSPYLDFRLYGTKNTYDGRIIYDKTDKFMSFLGATGGYVFDNTVSGTSLYSDNGLGLGRSGTSGTTEVNVNMYWADAKKHDIITRGASGLVSAFGWVGDATNFKTTTNLRGQTIQCNGSTTWSSDQNLKHDIRDFDERYDIFYANLKPRSYKYDLGSSGRTHIGYVTQEVEDALTMSGLTTQDFAGVVIQPIYGRETEEDENGNSVDIGLSEDNYLLDKGIEERHNLAYTEFIALNTYMIQKLLKENTELKERLAKLEESMNM